MREHLHNTWHSATGKLAFRLFAPIVAIVIAMTLIMYFFNLRALSDIAMQQIKGDFDRLSKEVYNLCDNALTDLLYEGASEDIIKVKIKKGRTINEIEDAIRRNKYRGYIKEHQTGLLLKVNITDDLAKSMAEKDGYNQLHHISYNNKNYYMYKFPFDPWHWEIVIVKDIVEIAVLPSIKVIYAITILTLFVAAVVLLYLIKRNVSDPIKAIINPIKYNRPPEYKGINEFEFLSSSIKTMMEQRARYVSELEHLNRTLEEKIKEEVSKNLKKDRLLAHQSRLAAMGEMIGAIAHQWRQPLNALGLIIQDIKDAYEFGELNEDYLHRNVKKSMEVIKSMSMTIDDFRNFFRPDKEKTLFDVKDSITNVLMMFSGQLKANSISFRFTCHAHNKVFEKVKDIVSCGEHKVIGYKNEFEHVIMNLINNAKDAFEAEARMSDSHHRLVIIDIYIEEDQVIVTLKDNAGGIPEGIIDRVFEPYFTTKEQGKGTGIGLYMSKMIIENNMGGSLTVRNVEGGAEFRIELPVKPKGNEA